MAEDKPRYSRITDLLDLIVFMSSKLEGVSLSDIMERYQVSRRTAERMRDGVMYALPQIDEVQSDIDRSKRWGFKDYSLTELVHFSDDNVACLENLKKNGDRVSWEQLDDLIIKIKALRNKRRSKISEDNIELILQTEGYAVRQTQNYKVDLLLLSQLRTAIRAHKRISVTYKDKKRVLEPLGMIFGEKVHLIAREPEKGTQEYNYIIHKIEDLQILEEIFEPNGFDLTEYSKQSFGVYFGEIFDIKLRFLPEVAEDVMNYNFHPTQKCKLQEDGSVIVTFKASGELHIIWNLFKWGTSVEILSPKILKKKYKEYIDEINKKL